MQTGTKILISSYDPALGGYTYNTRAKIARRTAAMGRMPAGYHPVRFEDGRVLLAHEDNFVVRNAS